VLVADDGTVAVSDWATADPKAPQHFLYYQGTASPAGDVRALARMVAEFLPTSGRSRTRPSAGASRASSAGARPSQT
jgi:hypothetical protein